MSDSATVDRDQVRDGPEIVKIVLSIVYQHTEVLQILDKYQRHAR